MVGGRAARVAADKKGDSSVTFCNYLISIEKGSSMLDVPTGRAAAAGARATARAETRRREVAEILLKQTSNDDTIKQCTLCATTRLTLVTRTCISSQGRCRWRNYLCRSHRPSNRWPWSTKARMNERPTSQRPHLYLRRHPLHSLRLVHGRR